MTLVTALNVLPASVMESEAFAVLAAFVAINTIVYAALAMAKALPKLHPGSWGIRRYQRTETRSIYPDASR